MFRLAVAQAPANLDTPADRIAWLSEALPEVVNTGADLVLLPELFACGYNIGGAVIHRAEPITGPTRAIIAQLAQQHAVAIHYGFAEQVDGTLYNAALCISHQGQILCHQRKLVIPPGNERSYFSAGIGCQIFTYKSLKIATLICYDAEFPETVRHVAERGADLILVPTALASQWAWVARKMIPTRAYENGVYLAYANSAGVENGMAFLGSSVIAAPDGTEAARAGSEPAIIHANIEKHLVTASQARLPYLADRKSIRF